MNYVLVFREGVPTAIERFSTVQHMNAWLTSPNNECGYASDNRTMHVYVFGEFVEIVSMVPTVAHFSSVKYGEEITKFEPDPYEYEDLEDYPYTWFYEADSLEELYDRTSKPWYSSEPNESRVLARKVGHTVTPLS